MATLLETGFTVPTLAEIIARISGDLQANLSGIDPYAPGSDEWAIARVLSGANYLQFGFQKAILRELFIGSASDINLPRIGGIWGVLQNQPTQSHYTIEVEALDATTIPAETLLTSSSGVEFLTDAELVFSGAGTDTVNVTSVEAGTDNNLVVGAALTFTVALPDVTAATEVTVAIEDATDLESMDSYRNRILERIQHHPQGGAEADYIQWTLDVDGVIRCWVNSPGLGEVHVVFDGTPSDVTVQAALDLVSPVTAVVTAIKGTEYPIALDIDVKVLAGYSQADVSAAIEASLAALFAAQGAPSSTIYNSDLRQAVSNAAGVDYFVLNDVILDGTPATNANANATTTATKFHGLDETLQALAYTWL